jgi:hypothetical protein
MLFPSAHALLARKLDHGRAEAALIALTPVPGVLPEAKLETGNIVANLLDPFPIPSSRFA